MTNKAIRTGVSLGALAVVSIIAMQAYWMVYTWNTEDQQLNQRIFVALRNVSESLATYNNNAGPPRQPVRQLSRNYYVVRVDDAIDANVLEHYLRSELAAGNVLTSFEYVIYDCADDRMLYGNRVSLLNQRVSTAAPRTLPTYSDYTYYFGVVFPDKSAVLVSRVQPWLWLSGGMLVIVTFFCYALTVMLRQKRLSELQTDFINNMTHEFKTPIATINVSADVLINPQGTTAPERLRRYATVVKEQTLRLNEQVERVLDIAQLEQRAVPLQKGDINIHQIITSVAESFSARYSHLNLVVNLQASSPMVSTDSFHLTNVLHNLVDNAIKYSPHSARVKITTWETHQGIGVQVADEGIGIPLALHTKVFTKFFRVPTGNVHNVKGFGLGLYYVKQVCRLHHWKIALESSLQQGSTFTITMPR
ncbi:MAG: HAMP domain-containing sensor histidine kinase [Tunicatimonas sp.]